MAPCGSTKRGLAWPKENTDPVKLFCCDGSKVSWLYNWSPGQTTDCPLSFAPMQWNNVNIDDLPAKLSDCNAEVLLGFNEPELPDQSNMTAELAANEWLRVIEPLRKERGIKCGSPGISSAGHAVGWLNDFLRRIKEGGSDVDFYCLHWYGSELGQFYDYIWSAYYQLPDQKKPVWITEFACTNWNESAPLDKGHVEDFARESCKYLDSLDWVEKYAWFGAMRNCGTVGKFARMIDDEGCLTPLGKTYCGI
ncbi:glycoside hydrolase family 128 protein [Piedraia hortae CBS 480.64]|uniref:Glycoside hydrolase family 128 protein n=1 Tax=Piedraia hortae CBS 480.64 TaxID=1314780 RepID=A0A6A7BS19_9PEZI|nr:glycoside hydrolase family 128 protein [Piedraia hortae CBS 480.64]